MKKLSIKLSDDIGRRFKIKTASEDVTMQDIASRLIEAWVNGEIPVSLVEQSVRGPIHPKGNQAKGRRQPKKRR